MSRKNEEAEELMRKAEKCLKTSLLRWVPEYELAADYYKQAAVIFKTTRSFDKAQKCLAEEAECYKQTKSWFHAGKCYEDIVIIQKQNNIFDGIVENGSRAAQYYRLHGSHDAAVSILDKSAKILEAKYPQDALTLYKRALEASQGEASQGHATEYASKVARILVKLKRYDEAINAILEEMELHNQNGSMGLMGRLTVALVIVQLARGDVIAADKAFKQYGNYCDVQEVQTLDALVNAYMDEDDDVAKQCLTSPFIKHMDIEYSILARELSLSFAKTEQPTPSKAKKPVAIEADLGSATPAQQQLDESPADAGTSKSFTKAAPPAAGAGAGTDAGLEEEDEDDLC